MSLFYVLYINEKTKTKTKKSKTVQRNKQTDKPTMSPLSLKSPSEPVTDSSVKGSQDSLETPCTYQTHTHTHTHTQIIVHTHTHTHTHLHKNSFLRLSIE